MGATLIQITTPTKIETKKGIQEKKNSPSGPGKPVLSYKPSGNLHLTLIHFLFLPTGYKEVRPRTEKITKPPSETLGGWKEGPETSESKAREKP